MALDKKEVVLRVAEIIIDELKLEDVTKETFDPEYNIGLGILYLHVLRKTQGETVRISCPFAVTKTVCSNCAESASSVVRTVQPSSLSTTDCHFGLPLIIGSIVKAIPSLILRAMYPVS